MEKLKMHTPDFTQANIARLAELFPNCVTETRAEDGAVKRAIDFDLLRQELSDSVVEGPRERYHLNWPGKREAMLAGNAPVAKTLRPCRNSSVLFNTSANLLIDGDNLDALKLLQETYLNRVKMIYIDPPYNTGSDFLYDDDYVEDVETYMLRSNARDENGVRLTANTNANGRFHSDWMSMMYPRVKLSRTLLRDDGAIFVSIGDHEVHNLRHMLDEVFGAENFVATIIWHKVYAPKSSAKHFSEDHDYIVVYAKHADTWRPESLPRTESQDAMYKNPDNDPRGPWRPNNLAARNYYSKGTYAINCPSGRVIAGPPSGSYWRISEDRFRELNADNRIWWGEDGNNVPAPKIFLSEVKQGRVPQTLWSWKEVGHNQEAKKELLKLLTFENSEGVFDTPKPTRLIQQMLRIGTSSTANDIVLDFFAGSGTTGEAVLRLNAEDGGSRSFILVQIPESTGQSDYPTICDIVKARLKAACAEVSTQLPFKDYHAQGRCFRGFRNLKVDTSNMKDVYYRPDAFKKGDLFDQVENIKEDRTPEDLLFQVLLDWGVDLSLPIAQETIDGKTVFFVDQDALAACFDKGVTEELVRKLAARKPLRVVFRDAGFGSDAVKINVEQIFKLVSPGTEVKAI
jgi:adenine-specific DNA-methyltransferase